MAKTVLVVEDEPNIVLSLKFLMRQDGYDVRVAEDGVAAIEEIEKRPPDLILLDIMLPKRDGFAVCEMIRKRGEWSKIKVIMLSAKNSEADRERAKALGVDDFVSKPFSTHDLCQRVKQFIED